MAGRRDSRGRGRRAFTLIEVIIACALAAVIAGAVLLAILAKIADAKIQRAITEVSAVETGVASWVYCTSKTTYSDITSINDLISAGAVAASLGQPGVNPWGGDYNVVGDVDTFAIFVTNLPSEAICQAVHRVFATRALINCTSNSPWQGRYTFGNVVIPPPGGGGGGGSTFALTVNTPSNGTVTASGISCPDDCSETYPAGSTVPLTAAPAANYDFAGWGGDCSGTESCSLVMNGNKSVSASFTLTQRTLTVTAPSNGTVSGTGIGCPGDCVESYDHGTDVMLTATPALGDTFSGWTGDCSGTGTCTLTMNVNKTVGATFTVTQHTLTVTVGANGSVSSSPAGISSCTSTGGTCSASFDHGTEVTLTAVGSSGYATGSWTGCDSASGDICVVTVTADRAVSVTFQPVVASDDFNRPANWSLGANWLESERNGDALQVNSAGVYMVPYWCCPAGVVPSAGLATWANLDTVEPQFSQLRRTDTGGAHPVWMNGVGVRLSGAWNAATGYAAMYERASPHRVHLLRLSGTNLATGSAPIISTAVTTIGSGQALRVEVTSNVVRVLVGGAEVITYTDPSPITVGSGRPGILVGLFSSSMVSVSPEIWDDWDGGRLP